MSTQVTWVWTTTTTQFPIFFFCYVTFTSCYQWHLRGCTWTVSFVSMLLHDTQWRQQQDTIVMQQSELSDILHSFVVEKVKNEMQFSVKFLVNENWYALMSVCFCCCSWGDHWFHSMVIDSFFFFWVFWGWKVLRAIHCLCQKNFITFTLHYCYPFIVNCLSPFCHHKFCKFLQ